MANPKCPEPSDTWPAKTACGPPWLGEGAVSRREASNLPDVPPATRMVKLVLGPLGLVVSMENVLSVIKCSNMHAIMLHGP
jgi:hypothetical protein